MFLTQTGHAFGADQARPWYGLGMFLAQIWHGSGADRACSWYRTRFRMWRHLVQDAEGMGTVAVPGSLPDGCDKAGHGRLDLVSDGLES